MEKNNKKRGKNYGGHGFKNVFKDKRDRKRQRKEEE
jgi:hypothetical protein